jgi:hypothetical protein
VRNGQVDAFENYCLAKAALQRLLQAGESSLCGRRAIAASRRSEQDRAGDQFAHFEYPKRSRSGPVKEISSLVKELFFLTENTCTGNE